MSRRVHIAEVATGDKVTLDDGRAGRIIDLLPVAPERCSVVLDSGPAVIAGPTIQLDKTA